MATGTTRYPDNEIDAGYEPIKDSTAISFAPERTTVASQSLGTGTLFLGAVTPGSTVTGPSDVNKGWHAKRMIEFAAVSGGGVRHIARDKEYAFRPKIAKIVHDSVTYRDFREPPSNQISSWVDDAETFGFEIGLVSDGENFLKGKPDFNPSHPNGRNQSTLIMSKEPLTDKDKDVDLPQRYFGRAHDMIIVRQTQDVKLKRVKFVAPRSGYFKRTPQTNEYQDAFWKAMWNITPFDQPFEESLKRKSEEDGGPDEHGFKAHDYSTAIDSELVQIAPPVFQGGWMFDGVLLAAGQIHDVLGVGTGEPYTRYFARDNKEISLVYLRHDAIFSKNSSTLGRIHFQGEATATDPWGREYWADLFLDTEKKGADNTRFTPHETGQWRVKIQIPEDTDTPTPRTNPQPENGFPGDTPTPGSQAGQSTQPPSGGGSFKFQAQEFEGHVFNAGLAESHPVWESFSEVAYILTVPLRFKVIPPLPEFSEIAFVFHARPDCPNQNPPPFTDLRKQVTADDVNDKGFCRITFPISRGHVEGLEGGYLHCGIWQTNVSTSTEPIFMGDITFKIRRPGLLGKLAPADPINLDQKNASLVSIPAGGSTSDTDITFEADLSDPDSEDVALEVELVLTSESFENTARARGLFVTSGATGNVTITGLSSGTYKWRARAINLSGVVSDWVAFADPSFTIT